MGRGCLGSWPWPSQGTGGSAPSWPYKVCPSPRGARHVPSLPAVTLRLALGVWRRGAASRRPFREEGPGSEALESRGVRSHGRRPEGSLQKYIPQSRPVLSGALQETRCS